MDRKKYYNSQPNHHILLAMKKKFIKFNTSVYRNMPRYIKLNLVKKFVGGGKRENILSQSRTQNRLFVNSLGTRKGNPSHKA